MLKNTEEGCFDFKTQRMRQEFARGSKRESIFFHSSQTAPKIREKNDYTNDSLTHPNVKKNQRKYLVL